MRFSTPSPLAPAAGRREGRHMHDHLRVRNAIEVYYTVIFAARALLPRRLAHWKESRLLNRLNPESRCSNPCMRAWVGFVCDPQFGNWFARSFSLL